MPHNGQSVWGGMIPNLNHPDTTPSYDSFRINGDPNTDRFNPKDKGYGGGLGMVRKPKPSPMNPSSGMSLSIPRIGAM